MGGRGWHGWRGQYFAIWLALIYGDDMTTYTTLSNALVGVGAKPFATTIQALRDNPIAIGEADATVPESLRNTQLLGTLTTTSGSTQTLSGLVLTPFRSLWISVQGVSHTSLSNQSLSFATYTISRTFGNTGVRSGYIQVDLGSGGTFLSNLNSGSNFSEVITAQTAADVWAGRSGYTTATTSISFGISAGTFDAGSILVYGVK